MAEPTFLFQIVDRGKDDQAGRPLRDVYFLLVEGPARSYVMHDTDVPEARCDEWAARFKKLGVAVEKLGAITPRLRDVPAPQGRWVTYETRESPTANGRVSLPGEHRWTLRFPLADGTELRVKLGRVGREAIVAMLKEEEVDDLLDQVPPGGG